MEKLNSKNCQILSEKEMNYVYGGKTVISSASDNPSQNGSCDRTIYKASKCINEPGGAPTDCWDQTSHNNKVECLRAG